MITTTRQIVLRLTPSGSIGVKGSVSRLPVGKLVNHLPMGNELCRIITGLTTKTNWGIDAEYMNPACSIGVIPPQRNFQFEFVKLASAATCSSVFICYLIAEKLSARRKTLPITQFVPIVTDLHIQFF